MDLQSFRSIIKDAIGNLRIIGLLSGTALCLYLSGCVGFTMPALAGFLFEPVLLRATDLSNAPTTQKNNVEQMLSFSDRHLEGKWVTNLKNYAVGGRTIVVNIGAQDALIQGAYDKSLKPRTSTIIKNVTLNNADSLVLITIKDTAEIGGVVLGPQWGLAGNVLKQYPKNIPLWKSTQDDVGIVEVDPLVLTGDLDHDRPGHTVPFQVKVNLWFSTGDTNCSIHRGHEFLEVHTQIYGVGRMQKFYEQDAATLYEDVIMGPGRTHFPFANVTEDDQFVYPWHQYYADTDTIWMAIEFHRTEN